MLDFVISYRLGSIYKQYYSRINDEKQCRPDQPDVNAYIFYDQYFIVLITGGPLNGVRILILYKKKSIVQFAYH